MAYFGLKRPRIFRLCRVQVHLVVYNNNKFIAMQFSTGKGHTIVHKTHKGSHTYRKQVTSYQ
jgi:hypothetical protein